jgi:hypothetical protein
MDGNVTILDQGAAIFAGAEALRLQDTVKGKFAHGAGL